MNKTILLLVSGISLQMLTSCSTFWSKADKPGLALEQEDERASEELQKATDQMNDGHFYYARAIAEKLKDHPTVAREANLILEQIDYKINNRNVRREQDLSANILLDEVSERLVLPDTYRKERQYVPEVGPFILEKGPMEEILNKEVTIKVEDADLQSMLKVLSEIEGLNLIADDELEINRNLTINVQTPVPLRDIMSYIERNMGLRFYVTKKIVWVTQGEADEEGAAGQPPALETKIIHLKKGFIPAGGTGGGEGGGGGGEGGEGTDDLLDALDEFFNEEDADRPEGAKFKIFRNRNILIIKDTRENMKEALRLVEAFDRDPMQVMIEARFVTISQEDLFGLGVDYTRLMQGAPRALVDQYASLPTYKVKEELGGQNGVLSLLGSAATGLAENVTSIQIAGIMDDYTYDITLAAMDKKGTTKVLSAPRVTVVNNQTARIRRGNKVFYFDEFDSETPNYMSNFMSQSIPDNPTEEDFEAIRSLQQNTTALVPAGRPQEIEEGLTLEIRPSIGNDGKSVSMEIDLSNTKVEGFESSTVSASGSYQLPKIAENEVQTKVTVGTGKTVVLGGTVTTLVEDKVTKIPILGDIPLLGNLFRSVEKNRTPQHMLIFITAKIIDIDGRQKISSEREDIAAAAEEVLRKQQMRTELIKDNMKTSDRTRAANALREAGIDPDSVLKKEKTPEVQTETAPAE